jgi:hypothetical protein
MDDTGKVKLPLRLTTTKRSPQKKRKSSPRPQRYTATRTRPRRTCPATTANMKAHWADPVWRAMMMEKRKAAGIVARGQAKRQGIPDGMRKAQAMPLVKAAKESAKETMKDLKKALVLEDFDIRGEEALEAAIAVMRSPGDKKIALVAARLVLDFTKSKPATRSVIDVNKAEDWLAAVAGKDGSDAGETPSDA